MTYIEWVKIIKWYRDGQKKYEGTWKYGEEISQECWDEDGYELEIEKPVSK